MQALRRSHVSLGMLPRSPRKLGSCVHYVVASNLCKVHDRARDGLVAFLVLFIQELLLWLLQR